MFIDMNYLISNTGKSELVSYALNDLSSLGSEKKLCFEFISHPTNGETALLVRDLDYEILVHPQADTTDLKSLLTTYTEEQKETLDAYIDSLRIDTSGEEPKSGWVFGRFTMRSVTEGFTDIYDYDYMETNGWF